jgi:hypothetical protein
MNVNQLIASEKINNLLQLATNYTECDETCQKTKKTRELHQKYLDSQTNLKNAPDTLEKNKKKYYVYTHGTEYYDDLRNKELEENATNIVQQLRDEFNSQIKTALSLNSILVTTDPESNCLDQYPIIQDKLNYELDKKSNEMLVNNRETYYDTQSIDNLKLWKKFLLFVYYFALIVFLILCFPKTTSDLVKYLFIAGLSFLYIFIINKTLKFLDTNKFKIFIFIIYFATLIIIILFILYKMATSFKYILINLTEIITKVYSFSKN